MLNEEHFTFHLQYKHSGTFANRKYEELSYPKIPKMCNPILVTLLKMRPHYSQSSHENATPSSSTSPLASYKEVPPPPGTFTTLTGKQKFLSYVQGTAPFWWTAVNVLDFSQQVQAPHTGGPSITGHPIPPPGGQPTKSTDKSNKQQPRQIASHFGPPLRYQGGPPGVQDGAKPSAKTGQQGKENKKPLPAGKQAKTNAWR